MKDHECGTKYFHKGMGNALITTLWISLLEMIHQACLDP